MPVLVTLRRLFAPSAAPVVPSVMICTSRVVSDKLVSTVSAPAASRLAAEVAPVLMPTMRVFLPLVRHAMYQGLEANAELSLLAD